MRVIWKFPLSIHATDIEIEVPVMAQIVLAALDPATGDPAIWVELDPKTPRVKRRFIIHGTGHQIDGDGGYPSPLHVGSLVHGAFVWHIFELRA